MLTSIFLCDFYRFFQRSGNPHFSSLFCGASEGYHIQWTCSHLQSLLATLDLRLKKERSSRSPIHTGVLPIAEKNQIRYRMRKKNRGYQASGFGNQPNDHRTTNKNNEVVGT